MQEKAATSQSQTVVLTQPPSRPPFKKILLVLLGLVTLVLVAEGVYFLTIHKKRVVEVPPEELVKKKAPPRLSLEKLKSDLLTRHTAYPIVVNGEPVTWKELEEAILYDYEVWQIGGYDSSEEKRLLIDRLVGRRLIEELALKQGISQPSTEELEKAKTDLFGQDYDFSRVSFYPEFQAQVETKALETKLKQNLVKTYTGAFIYVKYKSVGADRMKGEGVDPKIKAREKVEEYYALLGKKTLDEIIELINADQVVVALNDKAKIEKFIEIGVEEAPNPDIKDGLRELLPGQTSEIFVISGLFRPGATTEEDYGYGFIKLEGGRPGEMEDFDQLLQEEREKAKIEVFIK